MNSYNDPILEFLAMIEKYLASTANSLGKIPENEDHDEIPTTPENSAASKIRDNGVVFPVIKRVIYNEPATTVYFTDGTRTTVKASANDKFDYEMGLVRALIKRIFGTISEEDGSTVVADGAYQRLQKIILDAVDQKHGNKTVDEVLHPEKYEAIKAKEEAERKAVVERTAKHNNKRLEKQAKHLAKLESIKNKYLSEFTK